MPKRIIQPGDIYKIDGVPHQVITATSEIIGEHKDELAMSELVFWLDNLETNERVYLTENELWGKIECHK